MSLRRHRRLAASIEDEERIDQQVRKRLASIKEFAEWLLYWADEGLRKSEGYGNGTYGANYFLQEMENKDPGQELNRIIKGLKYYIIHGIGR